MSHAVKHGGFLNNSKQENPKIEKKKKKKEKALTAILKMFDPAHAFMP